MLMIGISSLKNRYSTSVSGFIRISYLANLGCLGGNKNFKIVEVSLQQQVRRIAKEIKKLECEISLY